MVSIRRWALFANDIVRVTYDEVNHKIALNKILKLNNFENENDGQTNKKRTENRRKKKTKFFVGKLRKHL